MPYAQDHYPVSKKLFDPAKGKGYPADFIAEGLDQTRGWFYSLLVLGVALFGESPYKHVIVNGLVLAEDGQKMSKKLRNYPDPMEVVDKYGADALRYYLLSSSIVRGEDLNFSEKGVDEVLKKVILRIKNVYAFLELFKKEKNISFKDLLSVAEGSPNLLDKWMLARLRQTIFEVTEAFETYELDRAARPVTSLIDDLSTWYLRRSRERIKRDSEDSRNALATLQLTLLQISKLLSPFTPFLSEWLYQKVRVVESGESVHLSVWPVAEPSSYDKEINIFMSKIRSIASTALLERAKAGIKVRQPLSRLILSDRAILENEDAVSILKEEVNVKEVVFEAGENSVSLDTTLTEDLKKEGVMREIVRTVQDERKDMGLNPDDKVVVSIAADPLAKELAEKFRSDIESSVNGKLIFGEGRIPVPVSDYSISVSVSKA